MRRVLPQLARGSDTSDAFWKAWQLIKGGNKPGKRNNSAKTGGAEKGTMLSAARTLQEDALETDGQAPMKRVRQVRHSRCMPRAQRGIARPRKRSSPTEQRARDGDDDDDAGNNANGDDDSGDGSESDSDNDTANGNDNESDNAVDCESDRTAEKREKEIQTDDDGDNTVDSESDSDAVDDNENGGDKDKESDNDTVDSDSDSADDSENGDDPTADDNESEHNPDDNENGINIGGENDRQTADENGRDTDEEEAEKPPADDSVADAPDDDHDQESQLSLPSADALEPTTSSPASPSSPSRSSATSFHNEHARSPLPVRDSNGVDVLRHDSTRNKDDGSSPTGDHALFQQTRAQLALVTRQLAEVQRRLDIETDARLERERQGEARKSDEKKRQQRERQLAHEHAQLLQSRRKKQSQAQAARNDAALLCKLANLDAFHQLALKAYKRKTWCCVVRRSHVVEDLVKYFRKGSRSALVKPMSVRFVGEIGKDQGGLGKEVFSLFFQRLADAARGGGGGGGDGGDEIGAAVDGECPLVVMENCEAGGALLPRAGLVARHGLDAKEMLQGVGRCLFRCCFLDHWPLPGSFGLPLVLFKFLLLPGACRGAKDQGRSGDVDHALPCTQQLFQDDALLAIQDFKQCCPAQARSLSNLLAHPLTPKTLRVSDFCDGASQLAGTDLKGSDWVTDSNKAVCVLRKVWQTLIGCRLEELTELRTGFMDSFGPPLRMFAPSELRLYCCGLPLSSQLLWSSLSFATEASQSVSPATVQFLRTFVHGASHHVLEQLLFFVTSLTSMSGRDSHRIRVEKLSVPHDTPACLPLPSAATCFNLLRLPEYPDQSTFDRKLRRALLTNKAGFHLL